MNDHGDPETKAIEALVQGYFVGMYEGDAELLRQIFHPQCWLFGEKGGDRLEFPLAGFLDLIASEQIPKEEGEPFDMTIASIDRTNSVAMAKVDVRYRNERYTDYLMLQKSSDGWRIVSKAFFCAG